MLINRYITKNIIKQITDSNKAVIIYGARQVGKTTLCEQIIRHLGLKTLSINADEKRYLDVLSSRDSRKLIELTTGYELLFIDEAQRIPDIGINLKILIDQVKNIKILVTGSSSFELANKINEPLTGRIWVNELFSIAQIELTPMFNKFELQSQIEDRLIWGAYPDIFQIAGTENKIKYLRLLESSNLYKDIFNLQGVRHADKINRLVKLLAFQIGQEVSINELATQLEISKKTVEHYIDLLEKTFIIWHLSGFSRNLRKEVSKKNKYYFYDLGIRNCVIDNFNSMANRNDIGALWENFILTERLKNNSYKNLAISSYFWRTYTGAEIDYIEESNGQLNGFEIKWRKKISKPPKTWLKEYPNAKWQSINNENWMEVIL